MSLHATPGGPTRRRPSRRTDEKPQALDHRLGHRAAGRDRLLLAYHQCTISTPSASAPGGTVSASKSTAPAGAVSGNACPQVFDASTADFYPIQPSFSAGYTAAGQHLTDTTANWAYVVEGDFPYSNWMAWYLYTAKGVPLCKFSDSAITPDEGSTKPFVDGNPILAPERRYTLYFMPSDTPDNVVTSMQNQGKNVALRPSSQTTPDVVIVSRSYWSFANDGLGDYDRFGYGGPTGTPTPTIKAYLTDATTGELTDTPVDDCSSQSVLPAKLWYDAQANGPIVTFADAPVPTKQELTDIPHFLVQTGSFSGSVGAEFPPSPIADEVQFYRDVASHAPFADVESPPPSGSPPDACGGYVMANLPNDVLSLVHIPQVPTFPDYSGATESTLNNSSEDQVQFNSAVIYGGDQAARCARHPEELTDREPPNQAERGRQRHHRALPEHGNVRGDPEDRRRRQGQRLVLLKSGVQTALAPNLMVIREKGQNQEWENALSANTVTQGLRVPSRRNRHCRCRRIRRARRSHSSTGWV